jgi:hypothetical protein
MQKQELFQRLRDKINQYESVLQNLRDLSANDGAVDQALAILFARVAVQKEFGRLSFQPSTSLSYPRQ